ncbi:hypothetical protein AB1Y20_010788 [Prymnesium parvum]|uniref:Uncharacterized protein n=1 Tax=Prymnesium parvum TaxID=97485 RepID=A0AB34IQN2_PRYPA
MGEALQPWQQYLEETQLLVSLECGLEEMLRACTNATGRGRRKDPINFLAAWLMRHNPRHDALMAQQLKGRAAAAAERLERENAELEMAKMLVAEAEAKQPDLQAAEGEAAAPAATAIDDTQELTPYMELKLLAGANLLIRLEA